MTGSVDYIESVTFPVCSSRSGSDGNTSFLLLSHEVHGCSAFVCFTEFMVNTGVIQYTLGGRCFARVDMSHYADIAVKLNGVLSGHLLILSKMRFLPLPSEMSKRFIRFCHLVGVFFLLESTALIVNGIEDFVCKSFFHCAFVA